MPFRRVITISMNLILFTNQFFFRNNDTTMFEPVNNLKNVAQRIGLDRCRFATVGGKTCKQEVHKFFLALGIHLVQLYAMTETG